MTFRIRRSTLSVLLLSGLLISATLLNREVVRVNLIVFVTSPYLLATLVYVSISSLLVRWRFEDQLPILLVVGIVGLGVTGLLSVLVNLTIGKLPDLGEAVRRALQYVMFGGAVVALAYQQLRNPTVYVRFLCVWNFVTVIVVIVGICQILAVGGIEPFKSLFYWENIRGKGTRIASTFWWQGLLVQFMGLSMPLLAATLILQRDRVKRLAYSFIYLAGLVVLFYSGSRTSLAMFPLILAPLFFRHGPNRFRGQSLMTMGAFVTIGGMVARSESTAIDRVMSVFQDRGLALTSDVRLNIWRQGLELWHDSWLAGIGPDQLVEYVGFAAHNGFIEALVGHGIMGLGFLVLFFGTIMVLAARLTLLKSSNQPLPFGMACGLLSFLLYNLSADPLNYWFVYLFLALSLATYTRTRNAR